MECNSKCRPLGGARRRDAKQPDSTESCHGTVNLVERFRLSPRCSNFRGNPTEVLAGRQGFEPRYRGPEPRVLPLDDLPVPAGSREGQELLILAYPKAPRQTGPLAAGRYRDVCSQRMSSSPKLPRPNWPRGIGFSD